METHFHNKAEPVDVLDYTGSKLLDSALHSLSTDVIVYLDATLLRWQCR